MRLPSARRRERPLTASAVRITAEMPERIRRISMPWQDRALYYRDSIGEIRYAAQFYGRMLKRVRLFPAIRLPDDSLEQIRDGLPVELLDRIQDPGGGRTSIFGSYGQLMFVTGEGYLFGRGLSTEEEVWKFVWRDELRFDDTGQVTHMAAPQLGDYGEYRLSESDYEPLAPGEAVAYRMWTPHPRYSAWPDSPMRAVLEECEELLILSRSVHATATSRLVRSMVLKMPQEISPPPIEPDGDEDPLNDPFLRDLTDHLTKAIQEPASAASMAPFIVWANSEYLDKIDTLALHDTDSDYLERELRSETLRRIARGLDMPPEVLEGMTDANHWAAWWISDDMWRSHGAPIAEQFCDDLSEAYLRPALRELGYPDWNRVVIGYDATAVTIDPDRSKDADQAWDRGAIGYEAYRRAKNFREEDAQTDEEHEEWLAVKLRDPSLMGLEGDDEGPPPGEPGDVSEGTNLPASAASLTRFQGAAELALIRCRELAGSRLRSMKKSCPECFEAVKEIPNSGLAAAFGADGLLRLGNPEPRSLVAGGADAFRTLLVSWGYSPQDAKTICDFLEIHAARTLFLPQPPAVPASLAASANGRAAA